MLSTGSRFNDKHLRSLSQAEEEATSLTIEVKPEELQRTLSLATKNRKGEKDTTPRPSWSQAPCLHLTKGAGM